MVVFYSAFCYVFLFYVFLLGFCCGFILFFFSFFSSFFLFPSYLPLYLLPLSLIFTPFSPPFFIYFFLVFTVWVLASLLYTSSVIDLNDKKILKIIVRSWFEVVPNMTNITDDILEKNDKNYDKSNYKNGNINTENWKNVDNFNNLKNINNKNSNVDDHNNYYNETSHPSILCEDSETKGYLFNINLFFFLFFLVF